MQSSSAGFWGWLMISGFFEEVKEVEAIGDHYKEGLTQRVGYKTVYVLYDRK